MLINMKTLNYYISKITLTTNICQNIFFIFVISFLLTSFSVILIYYL